MAAFFSRKPKFKKESKKKEVPRGLWTKCPGCGELLYNKTLEEHDKICTSCDYHFRLTAYERVKSLLDRGTFKEQYKDMSSRDPLNFKGPRTYLEKVKKDQKKTGLKDAAVVGEGKVSGHRIAFGATDSGFIMGSMGSVVGEKITRITEYALENKLPLVIVSGSGGGARMYEGLLSLMQMAKTSAALEKFDREGGLFISVLTNPTMAGVMASFASLGDIIMAEPKALIGFTGPRVIKQTIKQDLPEGFQSSEFLLDHGLIDMIVDRRELKKRISSLIEYSQ